MSLLDNIEDEELEIKKDIDTQTAKKILKSSSGKSLAEMVEAKKKPVKIPVAVYLTEEVSNKLKTLSVDSGVSIASILEVAINDLTLNLPIDEKLVKKYDKNNKSRGRKKA